MKFMSKIDKQIYLSRPLLDVKKKFLVKISMNVFGKYFKDPSNTNTKYLRTKVRNLKKHIENRVLNMNKYLTTQNLSLTKNTLDSYLNKVFEDLIKNREIIISFEKYNKLSHDTKIALINESIKKLKKLLWCKN